jgi:glycosyltransferase involved in cell wall biosynthesis
MGGISQYVLHLLPALAAKDDKNKYVILHSARDGRSYLPPHALNFQRRNLWTPCHNRWERWALSAELLRWRLDVLHSPDFIPPQRGAKHHVITVHDLNFIYYPQFLTPESRRYYLDQIKWAVARADHISVDSHATRRDVIELLRVSPDKITTIHLAANPIYAQPFAATSVHQTLAQYNLPQGYILFVGTLEPRKNLPLLIRAYGRLRQETAVDVPLVLVGGKGWIYDEIFATIEALGLRDHVRHLSGIFNEQLAHLYHGAGVLVTPSFYEGFGLPALEAQHCDSPVIVSNRGSLPEIVGEAGWKLDPDDENAWVEGLYHVLTDTHKRRKLIDNGRRQVAKFTWQKTAQMTLQMYEGVS